MGFEKNRGNNNGIAISGIAHVIIPENTDVAEYVQRCYRESTVSIKGDYGSSAMHHVKVTKNVLDSIKFPNGDSEGSMVVWLRESFTNRPIIIGMLQTGGKSNQTTGYQERIYQEAAEQIVDIFLDALNSRIAITAVGNSNKSAEVVIKATSGTDEGDVVRVVSNDLIKREAKSEKVFLSKDYNFVLNDGEKDLLKITVDIDGIHITDQWLNEFLIDKEKAYFKDRWLNETTITEEQIHFKSKWEDELTVNEEKLNYKDHFENEFTLNEENLHYKDHFGNEVTLNEENTQFLTSKFNIGEGKEQIVLGNTLVKLLGNLIDAITSMTVVTPHGPSGTPINAAQFTSIKSQLETALSKLSNTD